MPRPADDVHSLFAAHEAARQFPFGFSADSIEFVDKGFSLDRKYRIRTSQGDYLLRIGDGADELVKREEFRRIGLLYKVGLPVAEPVRFEVRPPFVGGLYRWIEGESGETVVPALPHQEQTMAGWEAGRLLKRLHDAFPSPEKSIDEAEIRGVKFRKAAAACITYGLEYQRREEIAAFVEASIPLLKSRPVAFRHGDYHPANLIFRGPELAGVIDFNRCDYGDPYDDFYKLAFFAAPRSAWFASGLINGYFEGHPPPDFWPLYNVYVAAAIPADLSWCARLFPSDLKASWVRVEHVLATHDFIDGGPPAWWSVSDL